MLSPGLDQRAARGSAAAPDGLPLQGGFGEAERLATQGPLGQRRRGRGRPRATALRALAPRRRGPSRGFLLRSAAGGRRHGLLLVEFPRRARAGGGARGRPCSVAVMRRHLARGGEFYARSRIRSVAPRRIPLRAI